MKSKKFKLLREIIGFIFLLPLILLMGIIMAICVPFLWFANDETLKETWRGMI